MRRVAIGIAGLAMAAGGALVTSSPADAQVQNGLVNVNVGDVSVLDNARVGVAAQVAANVCGVKVGPVAVLGAAVDRSGDMATVCTTPTGPVTITQA
jgi:hypothetical protein